MVNLKDVSSDSESEKQSSRKKKSLSTAKGGRASMDVDQLEDEGRQEEVPDPSDVASEEGEEEEYEIEAILEAKRGAFPGGRTGYFVKWKGYGPEENSWVDENDAGNATALIDAYWKNFKKEKQSGRKSIDSKPKAAKAGRKSMTTEDASEEEPLSRKRNRVKPKPEERSVQDSDGEGARTIKKPRKSSGATTKKNASSKHVANTPEEEDGDDIPPPVGDMKKHMSIPSWEGLIKNVDTVERDEGELWVYFTLKANEERVRAKSTTCAEKFPQKLIQFYESHLKWKAEDDASSMAES